MAFIWQHPNFFTFWIPPEPWVHRNITKREINKRGEKTRQVARPVQCTRTHAVDHWRRSWWRSPPPHLTCLAASAYQIDYWSRVSPIRCKWILSSPSVDSTGRYMLAFFLEPLSKKRNKIDQVAGCFSSSIYIQTMALQAAATEVSLSRHYTQYRYWRSR